MSSLLDWFDARVASVPPRQTMKAAGHSTWQTGSNCLTLREDIGEGACLVICTENNDIDGDANEVVWLAGCYDEEGGPVGSATAFTLAEAMTEVEGLLAMACPALLSVTDLGGREGVEFDRLYGLWYTVGCHEGKIKS